VGFRKTTIGLSNLANLSAETDLSEDGEVGWQRTVDNRRRNCQAECEIKAGLGNAYTTDG
tara:strand:- start:125 stop:304 length:180 start_codon:yes stop_codon:yes gene_type:complete